MTQIETANLRIILCDETILEKAIAGNTQLQDYLKVDVPDSWSEFGSGPLQYSLDKLKSGEKEYGWWTYLPVHKEDNKLIGSCGYKGPPDEKGMVEIGYEIKEDYRNKGFATELGNALIENAFSDKNVTHVLAHTLANINASTKVLTKCGFEKTGVINSDEDGDIWRWELKRMK